MGRMTTDLWPDDIGDSKLKSPLAILREQGEHLKDKTGGLVLAEVKTRTISDEMFHNHFELVVPMMDGYRYELLQVRHGVSFYPLDVLPRGASVVVAEFFETIVDWNRKFGFESETDRLADPRVAVEVTDVVEYLRNVKRPFDAILLDVDNGPDAWCLESNERLYDRPGLLRIKRALKPNGLLAVWSSEGSSVFEKRLAEAGYAARSETVRSRGHKGERHTIFLGTKPPA